MTIDDKIKGIMMTMRVIWFAMLISLVIYLVIGIIVGPTITSVNEDFFRIFRIVIYAVAFVTLIGTWFIRRRILTQTTQINEPSHVSGQPTLGKYLTAMIIALSLSETIAIYGLLLYFFGKNLNDLYLMIIISAAAMVIYRPKKDDLIDILQESEGYKGQ